MSAPTRIEAVRTGPWTQRSDALIQIFQKLEPTLLAISEHEPQAFTDCMQMVADVAKAAPLLDQTPSITNARALRRHWAKKVHDLMKDTEAKLYEHNASSGYIGLCWSMEEQLNALFTAAEDLIESNRPVAMVHGITQPAEKTLGTDHEHFKR